MVAGQHYTNWKYTSYNPKYIAVRYFFIKEKIEEGEIEAGYTSTLQKLAFVFTEPLQGDLIRMMRTLLHDLLRRRFGASVLEK